MPHDNQMYASATATADFFSPPVPLVALCGFPDLHALVRDNVPNPRAVNYASHADAAATQFGALKLPRRDPEATPHAWQDARPRGVFKRPWFETHRHAAPAVAVLLFEWDEAREWTAQEAAIIATYNQLRMTNATRIELRYMIVVVRHRNVPNGARTRIRTL